MNGDPSPVRHRGTRPIFARLGCLLVLASACGRRGFDPLYTSDGRGDDAVDSLPDASEIALRLCGDTSGLQAGAPWPLIHGCPTNVGRSAFLGPHTGATALGPLGTATAIRGAIVDASGNIVVQEYANGTVHCFDGVNGMEIWTSPASPSAPLEPFPVADAQNMLYATTSNGQVFARAEGSGSVTWTLQLSGAFSAPVMDAPGVFYFGAQGFGFFAVDTVTQLQKWGYPVPGNAVRAPALANGIVYFIDTVNERLYALDAPSGGHVFDVPISGGSRGSPVVGLDAVYVATMSDGIAAFDLTTGATKWQLPSGGNVVQPAVLLTGHLLTSTTNGTALILDETNGGQLQSFSVGGNVFDPPRLDAEDTAFFTTDSGIRAYAGGVLRWQSALVGKIILGNARVIVLPGTQTLAAIGP